MFKFLPVILVVVALAGSIFYFQRREELKKKMDQLLQKSKTSMTTALPEPTPVIPVKKGTDLEIQNLTTLTPTPVEIVTTKGGLTPIPLTDEAIPTQAPIQTVAKATTVRTVTVCTPVYGMANSCAEHVVVDTGLDSGTFMNLAGISYLGGLMAFVKAKRRN